MRTTILGLFSSFACASFVHPGVYLNASDLVILSTRLAAGTEPQTTAYATANASPWGSLGYRIFGPPADGAVTCGSYDKPNIGCSNETSDADAAFLHALLYNITANPAHASLSRRIISMYTNGGLRSYNDSNAPLQAAWCGVKWTRAAELLRSSTASGWTVADTAAFAEMITKIHLPLIYGGSRANGNWELSMIDAMIGFSVFLEDAALMQHAVTFWRQRTPSYFYNAAIDGDAPAPFPPGREGATWYNQTVFNATTNGVCQETCRDFGHMQMGLGACLSAAATARIAGIDLFAEEAPRLADAMEFAAGWLLQGGKPQSPLLCSGAPLNLALVATFEVGYRELSVRLGHSLPLTQKQLEVNIRPHASPDSIVSDWETLTHGAPF